MSSSEKSITSQRDLVTCLEVCTILKGREKYLTGWGYVGIGQLGIGYRLIRDYSSETHIVISTDVGVVL